MIALVVVVMDFVPNCRLINVLFVLFYVLICFSVSIYNVNGVYR